MKTNKPKNTDQDLLELAAKAAGINIFDWTPGGRPTTDGSYDGIWNPLDDDGDALRLAIDLNIAFRNMGHVMAASSAAGQFTQYADGDPYSATRRAIVRAAAEMGRDKP